MKEIKRGDFTGIYSQIDGKPLFYTGQYDYMECSGLPCVWLATDINNNLTFSRWSQQELNKRGWTVPPRPVEISKTAMQMIQKAGAMIRWTTAEERRQANTDHKRKSPYILTDSNGGQWYTTGTCADVRKVLKAAADEATTRPQDGPTAPETETAGETTTSSEKAPQEATSEAKTTLFYYIVTNNSGETVAAGEVAAPIEEITATATREAAAAATRYTADTGRPARYTCGGSKTPIAAAALEFITRTTAAQRAPTQPETVTDKETPTPAQDTTGSDTRPPRAQEANQEPGHAAGTSEGAETTTPPHTEPPRATDAAGGSVSQSDRRTRPAAPQSHGTTKGIQRHHRPPKTAYRAIQRAATTPPSAQKTTFSAWMHKTGSDPPKI